MRRGLPLVLVLLTASSAAARVRAMSKIAPFVAPAAAPSASIISVLAPAALGPTLPAPSVSVSPPRAPAAAQAALARTAAALSAASEEGRDETAVSRQAFDAAAGPPWSVLVGEFPVILLGEDHGNLWMVDALTRELPRLKEAGLTHVGLEGYAATLQPAIDSYLAGGGSIPHDDGRYRSGQYRTLFVKARELGVRILAIDMPDALRRRLGARLERRFVKDPALARRLTPPGRSRPLAPSEAADSAVTLDWRNRYMARVVEQVRRGDPSAKFLLLVGAAHARSAPIPVATVRGIVSSAGLADIGEVLRRRVGIQTLSVRVVGGRHGLERHPAAQWFESEAGQPVGLTRLSPETAVWNLGRTSPPR